MNDQESLHDDPLDEIEPIEAYCMHCRQTVEMESPEAVWTSKGTPGTRGICPDCGTTVFRMGKTPAHDALTRPAAVRVGSNIKTATNGGRRKAQPATYINYTHADAEFATKLATDLENAGVHTWIDSGQEQTQEVKWAGGVHPALKESVRMVVILSGTNLEDTTLTDAWRFFKTQKKPIVLAMTEAVEVPDPLRRSPRFDFSSDYTAAFRQLLLALSD
ncbi:MAG: TIR domain-containing protein [Chloroflexota bacterium]